jgi:hypothetical protein
MTSEEIKWTEDVGPIRGFYLTKKPFVDEHGHFHRAKIKHTT